MIIGLHWVKRLILGFIGLLILVVVLGLIFSSLILLIPIVLLLIAIGFVIKFFRKAGKISVKRKKDYIDVDYKVEK